MRRVNIDGLAVVTIALTGTAVMIGVFGAAPNNVSGAVAFTEPLGWLAWFTILCVAAIWLVSAPRPDPGAGAEHAADTAIIYWTWPAALAAAWALAGFEVVGSFSEVTEAVTIAHGLLAAAALLALLVQPLVAAAIAWGAPETRWTLLRRVGAALLAIAAAGIAVTIVWNPTLWDVLARLIERAWLAAALGSLVWSTAWSATLALLLSRRAGRIKNASPPGASG